MGTGIYSNVRIWDGISSDYRVGAIEVADGRISAISDSRGGRDCSGLTAIPGLMDAHVHMTLDHSIHPVKEQLEQTNDEIREKMLVRAQKMVEAGITTARDLGGGAWLELELRDQINCGEVAGPRLLCAGQPITSPHGHCHFWGGESATLDDAYEVIARQHGRGVDLIKIMATGGDLTKGTNPAAAQFSQEVTTAIVQRARSLDYEVAAHCHGIEGIAHAAHAAVTTIEHCSWVASDGTRPNYDPEVAQTIIDNGVWVSPTINAGWVRFKGTEREDKLRSLYREFKKAGVNLVASTDAGIPNVRHEDLPKALQVFAYFAELSPREVLQTATVNTSKALAIEHIAGTITPGMSADMIFLEGDPLEDLECLQVPAFVLARGREFVK
jgi:imidazolonepropionase-like amidohydrolase|tara:strand:+ start:54 stop:1205 length:1152 start_codon:yes stop_codon:yes gene_type:complete